NQPSQEFQSEEDRTLTMRIARRGVREAAELVAEQNDANAVEVLRALNPAVTQDILAELDADRVRRLLASVTPAEADQWKKNQTYPDDTIGWMMEAPTATFLPEVTVAQATEVIRELVKRAFVTYGFVIDKSTRLLGLITMRDLLLSSPGARLGDIMLKDVFYLAPDLHLREAMKLVLNRHFPVYPVCDSTRRLVGQVRGQAMFEEQAYEISAQPGTMVGVDKEERLATPWVRSLKFRHPWLQLNLLTAFLAAAVVGVFQETVDRVVILAMFLPVLAGQSGNTGCQALAVALRGLTLGELAAGRERELVAKEAFLGLLNGVFVGMTAGIGMFVVASMQKNPSALVLAAIVFIAMTVSCVISGIAGALIPLTLRKLGADPATASSIFLTTATDVASMGIFLALATLLVVT
ncbi:MAG: magnesium transporter, partial [Thermoanaerobaculia bacterium]|nr:magnesium transporter [Thermoanaerobaculia bacterium]